MLFHAQEKTLFAANGAMTYVVFGSGDKPLVILPGLSLKSIHGTALPLAWMYRTFCREYRIYVFDRSKNIQESCSVSDLAEDVADAMQTVGIGCADVIGISQGGMMAQYLALNHPELVRKLVLGVTLSRTNDTVRRVIEKWVQDAQKRDYQAIVQDIMSKMYSERYIRKYRWLFPVIMKSAELNAPERFIRLAKSCLTCDTYDRLNQIKCPVLVLGGKEDQIVTAKASEEIAERLGCQIYMYDGLGHSAYEEGKDFNRRIYLFLKEISPGPDEKR